MSAKGKSGKKGDTPMLEWIAGGIGLLLILLLMFVIASQAFSGGGDAPPMIEARVGEISPAGSGYVVELLLGNRSTATAAAVEVEGELLDGERVVATSSATIDYVPGESTRGAGLYYAEDPRRYRLDIRVLGYAEP
jgi:uncharacterized protein (TIGR02588 family)